MPSVGPNYSFLVCDERSDQRKMLCNKLMALLLDELSRVCASES